ncbi:helix-turn-helix domain-containing protein [Streptomyces xinghaiensis]|uniref:helix-turn-helix domain-containing protein n=1 Tax=Streptomyces xinghaiensis TaxID=1038928 RepID=UPI000BB0B042|nr:XRE family transcriptional regulator [Streptomyces xinghaiensis]
MPRWKVLPEELDPQIREFTGQLRRIVELSGLGVGSVADRTGYSKTSWDRYLNGRLLPPLGAVVALAEVTGYATGPLTAQWERAEAAWARAEAGHDPAAEQRQAPPPGQSAPGQPAPGGAAAGPTAPGVPSRGRPAPGRGTPGHPAAPDEPGHPTPDTVALSVVTAPGAGPGGGREARSGDTGSGGTGSGGARRLLLFGLGLAGALAVTAGAVFFLDLGDGAPADGKARVATTPTPTPEPTELPEGVNCSGDACTGEDPEEQGCGGEYARTVTEVRVGAAFVEMRHSEVCGAVWARITEAAAGDSVRVAVGQQSESAEVAAGSGGQPGVTEAYTLMVAAGEPADAEVCGTTVAGEKGCARPSGEDGSGTSAPPGSGTSTPPGGTGSGTSQTQGGPTAAG